MIARLLGARFEVARRRPAPQHLVAERDLERRRPHAARAPDPVRRPRPRARRRSRRSSPTRAARAACAAALVTGAGGRRQDRGCDRSSCGASRNRAPSPRCGSRAAIRCARGSPFGMLAPADPARRRRSTTASRRAAPAASSARASAGTLASADAARASRSSSASSSGAPFPTSARRAAPRRAPGPMLMGDQMRARLGGLRRAPRRSAGPLLWCSRTCTGAICRRVEVLDAALAQRSASAR